MTDAITQGKRHSEGKLAELRERLSGLVVPEDVVVACGSYARREASEESDIDYFVITPDSNSLNDPEKKQAVEAVKKAIADVVDIAPAEGGAFSELEARDAMTRNIGGDYDDNQKITRRMLFLLEGEWLFNEEDLKQARRGMLERYIGEAMTDHQLALFLLNDIIRYYRTVAVDYEFKTTEGPKPWGIRNIKLVFSRKLLYASGLFSVAMTADRARDAKIEILEHLFDMPVIERMIDICGRPKFERALSSYNIFLGKLEEAAVRQRLKELGKERAERPTLSGA